MLVCMGGPRLLVHRSLYDTTLGILADAVPAVPVGDPFDPATVVGPITGERHVENVERFVEAAVEDGGRIVVRRRRPPASASAWRTHA